MGPRRSTGNPNRKPATQADAAGDRQRNPMREVEMNDEDCRRISPDRVERAVAQGDLAR
jgi:hypothetical protein